MIRAFLTVAFLLLSTQSWAGAGGVTAGDGGWGARCLGTSGARLELLDFAEARFFSPKAEMALGGSGLSIEAKVQIAIERLMQSGFSHEDAQRVRFETRRFLATVEMSQIQRPRIYARAPEISEGLKQALLTRHCDLVLMATTMPIVAPRAHSLCFWSNMSGCYVVNNEAWQQMDNDSRAGLALHEALRFSYHGDASNALRSRVARISMEPLD